MPTQDRFLRRSQIGTGSAGGGVFLDLDVTGLRRDNGLVSEAFVLE